jgi:hypothetical protein
MLVAALAGGCTLEGLKQASPPLQEFACYLHVWPFRNAINLTEAEFEHLLNNCTSKLAAKSADEVWALPMATTASRDRRVSETVMAQYLAEKKVTAAKFPRTVIDLSADAVRVARLASLNGRVEVLAMMAAFDGNLEVPGQRFEGFEARLLAVDAKGRTTALDEASVDFADEEPFSEVRFLDVEAEGALRVVIQPTSGQLEPALALAAAGVAGSLTGEGGESEAMVGWEDVAGALSPDGSWGGAAVDAKGAELQSETVMLVHAAEKVVTAKKFPNLVLDLPSTRSFGNKPEVAVGVNLLTERFTVPPAKKRFERAEATLFAVDSKGRQKRVATKTEKFDADGLAAFSFRRLEEPKKGHFRLRIKVLGGKIKNSTVLVMASTSAG